MNPANERLQGTQFTPDECSRRLPGGLAGIIYPPQVIDGLVSELGGPAMAAALEQAGGGCATGGATAISLFFPLNTIRLRLQIDDRLKVKGIADTAKKPTRKAPATKPTTKKPMQAKKKAALYDYSKKPFRFK